MKIELHDMRKDMMSVKGGGADKKNHSNRYPLKAIQRLQTWFLCTVFFVTIMHRFLVKAINCVKGVIKLNC